MYGGSWALTVLYGRKFGTSGITRIVEGHMLHSIICGGLTELFGWLLKFITRNLVEYYKCRIIGVSISYYMEICKLRNFRCDEESGSLLLQ